MNQESCRKTYSTRYRLNDILLLIRARRARLLSDFSEAETGETTGEILQRRKVTDFRIGARDFFSTTSSELCGRRQTVVSSSQKPASFHWIMPLKPDGGGAIGLAFS